MMKGFRNLFAWCKKSFNLFNRYNGLKLSASLSFYTVFSLAPFLIVVISVAGIFLGKNEVEGKVFVQLSGLIGKQGSDQIKDIIQYIQHSNHGIIGGIVGFVVLMFGASAVFSEIQESINFMWAVNNKKQQGWLNILIRKLLSFSLLIGMGFILIVSLLVNAATDLLSDRLKMQFPEYSIYLFYGVNILIILFALTILFAVIFKVLPNAAIRWKDAITGAVFTALLFLAGKFLIGFYLGNSRIGLMYGTAASVVVLMLWVYYSSIILYFGAAFTKIYSTKSGWLMQTK